MYLLEYLEGRNVFRAESLPEVGVFYRALYITLEWKNIIQLDFQIASFVYVPSSSFQNLGRQTLFVSWLPPPRGSFKVNFDGYVKVRFAASRFFIRDNCGELEEVSTYNLGEK